MHILTVTVPSFDTFETYWYGNGEIVSIESVPGRHSPRKRWNGDDWVTVTVNYGDDKYRADYQAGRFGSGLYFAQVEEV